MGRIRVTGCKLGGVWGFWGLSRGTEHPLILPAACAEAYSNAEEQFGCVTGCRKQLPEVESRREKVRGRGDGDGDPLSPLHPPSLSLAPWAVAPPLSYRTLFKA